MSTHPFVWPDTDPATRAELDALLASLEDVRATKIGFPDATDFDYTELAPFFARFLINNLGDPWVDGRYPWQVKAMEREAVEIIAGLLRAPEGDWWGYVTSGASEGTEWALWQARRRYPDALVYTSTAAHHAVRGVLDRLDMASVAVRADRYGEIDYDDFTDQLNRHRAWPAIVVANAGTATHEAVDDVRRIRRILDDLAIRRCWVHVDAALSGLPLALMDPDARPGVDFADGADSVIVSVHKFIGSPIPSGALVVRGSLHEHGRAATYTGAPDTTVSNSRSGLAVLVLWYALRRLGVAGLRARAEQARDLAAYAHGRLVGIGWPEVHRHPHSFTVTFAAPPPWIVNAWSLPGADRGLSRLVCMPGVTRDQIDAFVSDLTDQQSRDAVTAEVVSTANGRRPALSLRRLVTAVGTTTMTRRS